MPSLKNSRWVLVGVGAGVASALLALVSLISPWGRLLVGWFWSLPLSLAIAGLGPAAGLLASGIVVALVWGLAGPISTLFTVLPLLLVGWGYGQTWRWKWSPGRSLAAVTLAAGAVSLALTGLAWWVWHQPPFPWGDQLRNSADQVIATYQRLGLLDQALGQGLTEATLRQQLVMVVGWLERLAPSIGATGTMLEAGIAYYITTAFFCYLHLPGTDSGHGGKLPLYTWALPWYSVWVFMIGLGMALAGDYLKQPLLVTIGGNLLYLYLAVAFAIGLAVISFYVNKYKLPPVLEALGVVVILINLPFAVAICAAIGLFDPLFNWRRLGKKGEGVG